MSDATSDGSTTTSRRRWDPRSITAPAALFPLGVLFALNAVDELDRVAFGVLTPEIRDEFGLSIAGATALATAVLPVALLLELPVAYWADRRNRARMAAIACFVWAGFTALTGLAPGLFVLFIARMGSALGKTLNATHNSLIADYYAPDVRPRAYYAHQAANPVGRFVGPLAAGLLAAALGWRAPFVILAIPSLVFAVMALRLREPKRGFHERVVAGADEETAEIEEEPASFGEAFRTLWSMPTPRRIYLSMPFLTAAVVGVVVILSLFYDEVYDVSEAGRGLIFAIAEPFSIIGLLIGAKYLQAGILRDPALGFRLVGLSSFASCGCLAIVALSPNVAIAVLGQILMAVVVGALTPGIIVVASLVVPPHMRTQGFAVVNLFVLLGLPVLPIIGGIGDAINLRVAILVLLPILAVGGVLFASAGRFVEADIERVRSIARARAEARRLADSGSAPLLTVSGLDVAYGQTQVLFGVDLEVRQGEIVALLGTNGAGKSTVLRAISGLAPAMGGYVLFEGREITTTDANSTAKLGITQVPGGRGVFPTLTVKENLRAAAWLFRKDKAYIDDMTAQVLTYFPALERRWNTPAGDLSGGEQQMLSLGQAFLAKPKLLMIDELSLGLAPTIVDQLLGIVRAIHANGTTILVVEQSVRTALRLAERAVFLEKGEVRFSGPTTELLERGDILRAVYLKGAAAVGPAAEPSNANGRRNGRGRAKKVAAADTTEPVVSTDGNGLSEGSTVRLDLPASLEVTGLTKRYGGVTAVDDVTFDLRHGEVLGVIGPNGAGKTTVFDLISGFAPLDGGRVVLEGVDVTDLPAHRRAARGLGRSFQDARLWHSLTVREAIAVATERTVSAGDTISALLGMPAVRDSERRVAARVDELIDLLGVGAFRDKFIAELSTGSRRMVEIACLIANEPRIILLDEPSSGIAQKEAEALGPVLKRVQQHLGASILIIEHDMPLLTGVSDRLLALDTGRFVTTGPADEVLAHPQVVSSYLGEREEALT